MPVTYTFTTLTSLPTSTEWDCMDFTEASMPNILLVSGISSSRGAPWFSIDGSNDLVIYSDDGALSELIFDLPLGTNHTFETVFKPSDLPDDLSTLDQHLFFIGTFDKQDNASGVLLSKTGLALVASFGSSALILPGSQSILSEGDDYYTLRLVVDGENDLMYLYITKTADLPLTGHILRYTSAAAATPTGTADSVKIQIIGQSDSVVTGKFSDFSCSCSQALVPNKRPIADAGSDQTANIGSAVSHDGRNSYDPEGAPLSYDWALIDAPDGSRFKSTGSGGSTVDDGDTDGFTPVFDGGSSAFSVGNMPLLQPGDHLEIDGVFYKVSTTRWSLGSSGKYERDVGAGWVDDEIVVDVDEISDSLSSQSWKVFHSATYFVDQTQGLTSAIPDKAGIYSAQLVVNDGDLDSFPSTSLLNVTQTSVVMGCIPDVSWIWNYLADFWNLLEDREVVETVWSGFAQACAAQLLNAWQADYNKSLIDIQRVFQRRWLDYSTLLDETSPDSTTIRILRGKIYSVDLAGGVAVTGKTLQLVLDNGSVETITFSGGDPVSAASIAAQINQALGFTTTTTPLASVETDGGSEYLVLEYALLLRIRPNGTANSDLGFSTSVYTQNDLTGTLGGAVSADKLRAFEETDLSLLDYAALGVGSSDLLVLGDKSYRVVKTAKDSGTGLKNTGLTLKDDLPVSTVTTPVPWLVPSIVVSEDIDFEASLVTPGDLVRFEVRDRSNVLTEVQCSVTGVRYKQLGFDPLPLLQVYDGDPSSYSTEFLGVRYINRIPVDDLVVDIPRLQEVIKAPPSKLDQNTDYTVETVTLDDGSTSRAVVFKSGTFSLSDPPADTYWAEITYLDNRPTIEANFGRMVNFKVEDLATRTDDLDYLSAVRGLWWAYFGGPALSKVKTGVQILLGLPFSEAEGTITSIEPNFSAVEGRIVIEDLADSNIVRTYFYPLDAGLAINDSTGSVIAEGDVISQFAPLSGGVEVEDWKSTANWLAKYVSQGKFVELEKYFRFLIRMDVDTFNLTNLIFAIDFAKKIKPHYTYPLFVLIKNVKQTEVDITDTVSMNVRLDLYDTFCPAQSGAYRWDDTDESGVWTHAYDEAPPRFVYDTHRLCPVDSIWAIISYEHPGGAGWFFDTIWAYDDGDTTGDAVSDDLVPLSGPGSVPPPYGPLVGIIDYDASVTAGVYTRSKNL